MKIGVLGTGTVAQTLGRKFASLGRGVMLGSRTPDNAAAAAFVADVGRGTGQGTFAQAAAFGDVLVNATAGGASLAALGTTDPGVCDGKVLIDVANPLDFSGGFPPVLSVCNDDSLAEQIQRAHPHLRVVKSLNTMAAHVMVDPGRLAGESAVFLSGDDAAAKSTVRNLLKEMGWSESSMIDLGDITSARGTEMLLPLWLRLFGALGTGDLNLAVVRNANDRSG